MHIRIAGQTDIDTIGRLARVTWPVAYGTTLTTGQIDYMLNLYYSSESLNKQMTDDGHIFLLAEINNEAVGFAAYGQWSGPGVYKLHKLYVLPGLQGKGVGRMLLMHIIEKIVDSNATALRLNVNRYNPARHFYNKLGFEIVHEEVIDIGNGYVMDDYVMEKKLG